MMVDKDKLIKSLEENADVLMNSKNPDDERVAISLIRLTHDIKNGKYDIQVWE
ncbi:hypothetical protein [Priestia flexa]|uniref:hypothetical protein n=1 Tax=Priestia flexa TaxID=86664 RepID=UPI001363BE07|nr:hypothetical protein [Priestia flexa]